MSRVNAVIGLVSSLGGLYIGGVFEREKTAKAQAEQRAIREELAVEASKVARCQTEQEQALAEQKRLQLADQETAKELSVLRKRLQAATSTGQSHQLGGDNLDVILARGDWISIPLAGRAVTVELDRVLDDGALFRLGGCQDPPPSGGLQPGPGVPIFKLTQARREQQLRLSASCCEAGLSGCEEGTLQRFSVLLSDYDHEMHRAHVLAKPIL